MPELKVEDLMTDEVYSINPGEDLARLSDLMSDVNIRHVPVVDPERNLVGIVSQRGLMRAFAGGEGELPGAEFRDFLKSARVEEIMTEGVVTVEPETDITEAASLMLENKMGCLPVVENEKLIGILTEADFVKFIAENATAIGEAFRKT